MRGVPSPKRRALTTPRAGEGGARNFLRILAGSRLTFRGDFRIFPSPGDARARSFQKANPGNNRERSMEATSGRPRKKVLDSGSDLRETGNPPLDGTGSLKTEQRRTREGRRKSMSRGGLRDSFEELVRRDGLGSTGRWLDGLQ